MFSATWARATITRANVDLALQRPGEAVELASRVLAAIERNASRHYLKSYEEQAALAQGKGLLQLNHPGEALPLLKRAVELGSELYDREGSPALARAKMSLAECLVEVGEPTQARALLAQATAIQAAHRQLGQPLNVSLNKLEHRLGRRN